MSKTNRRSFLQKGALLGSGLALSPLLLSAFEKGELSPYRDAFFKISLAQWSLHKALFSKKITNMDFPAITKNEFGIEGVEFVNQFFKDKAKDTTYLTELKTRCTDNGVTPLIIMIDGEGGLGHTDKAKRTEAVEKHYKWVEAAKFLGCHSIRVNAYGVGEAEEVKKAAIKGLSGVAKFARDYDINVIVENHGGYSSNGQWLSEVMTKINMDNCGTLPDFGNFCIKRKKGGCEEEYDRYKGVTELMPHAKSVSAKTHDFNDAGDEIHTDYLKMMTIVKEAGYKGWVGIEYEGSKMGEYEGIKATKALLEKVGKQLS